MGSILASAVGIALSCDVECQDAVDSLLEQIKRLLNGRINPVKQSNL